MKLPEYEHRIPAVLVMMLRHIKASGGADVVGIFRLAPGKEECNVVKQQINTGQFESCDDVNILANLIKVCLFFFAFRSYNYSRLVHLCFYFVCAGLVS